MINIISPLKVLIEIRFILTPEALFPNCQSISEIYLPHFRNIYVNAVKRVSNNKRGELREEAHASLGYFN